MKVVKSELLNNGLFSAILVIIALFYVLLIVKIILVLCSFRPYDKVRSGERARLLSDERRRRKKQEKLNYGMLRCLAPCATDEDSINAFKNIAVILNMVFSDKDLVPSDVLAGLILLSHAHNYTEAGPDPGDKVVASTVLESNGDGETGCVSLVRVCDGDNDQTSGQCGFIDIAREDDRIRIDWARVKHYYKFAAAAYGYMWWVLQSPVTHCCKLGCYLQCCPSCCGNTDELFVEGDGMFKPNYGAIKAMLNIEDRDVIVFDNRNMIEEVPYLMVADKATKSLVISIRGTLSLNDMLTDLRGEPSVIMDEEPDWLGHQGMVNAAKYVFTRLHGQQTGRDRSSRSYTDRCQQRDILACSLTDPEYAGYEVVVTGHSLGAGTATILAFLLRAAYPATRITCYAYSPPGGLLSLAAARESEKFCVSVVVGDDVIPRLSLTSIGVLARDIKQMIAACRLPKYQVFGYGCMACCCKQTNNPLSEEIVRLFPRDGGTDSPNTTADTAADTVTEADTAPVLLNQCPSTEDLVTSIHPPPFRVGLAHHCLTAPVMFLPGRILHIQPSPDGSTYQVTEQTRRAFSTILVTPSMLSDHFPNNLQKVLESCPQTIDVLPVRV